jgi:hypothetical protein
MPYNDFWNLGHVYRASSVRVRRRHLAGHLWVRSTQGDPSVVGISSKPLSQCALLDPKI